MNTTDTPETDRLRQKLWGKSWSDSFMDMMFHAGQLERRLIAANQECADQKRMVELLKTQLTGKLEEVVKNHGKDLTCARGNDTKSPV